MASKLNDELFRTVLLASLRNADPSHLKDILGDDDALAEKALRAHNDKLQGRLRGNVDQLAILTEGARSHRSQGKTAPAPPQRNRRQKAFDDATDRVRKIFESSEK